MTCGDIQVSLQVAVVSEFVVHVVVLGVVQNTSNL